MTYSFSDVTLTLSHPSLGVLSTNGMGVGSISKSMTADKTQIDVASDGTAVTSKIRNNTGSLTIQCQQNSVLHQKLKTWLNYLTNAKTSEWALIKAVLTSSQTGEQDIFTGGSIPKHADVDYNATIGMVTWNIMFAEVVQNNI